MRRWRTTQGNLVASNVRQYGGGQQDKRRGVKDRSIGWWATQQEREWQCHSLSYRGFGMEDDEKNWKAGEKGIGNVLLDLL
jgi:hypothetical protein